MRALLFVFAACTSKPAPMSPDASAPKADGDTALGPAIPASSGACPQIVNGDVTFSPAGMPPRKVKLALIAGATSPGPLLLYWHATGSSPNEASYALGTTQSAIMADGGIIASPYSDDAAGTFEWFVVNGSPREDDFLLADEIVACLVEAGRIEPTRIHSLGMSAGGLQTTAFSFYRSAYIASVATFSGGLPADFMPPNIDTSNKFAALIFNGGSTDNVFGLDFKAASENYRTVLTANGHYAAICEHDRGHEIPLDAAPSVRAFFTVNPYGAWPSPYETGLPSSFPAYCAR